MHLLQNVLMFLDLLRARQKTLLPGSQLGLWLNGTRTTDIFVT